MNHEEKTTMKDMMTVMSKVKKMVGMVIVMVLTR